MGTLGFGSTSSIDWSEINTSALPPPGSGLIGLPQINQQLQHAQLQHAGLIAQLHAVNAAGPVMMVLTDYRGKQWQIEVDARCAANVTAINSVHAYPSFVMNYQEIFTPPKTVMADNGFSLDEMSKAEELMEEMRA